MVSHIDEILFLLQNPHFGCAVFGFRWEVVGDEDGIQYGPFPVPKRGLPIRVSPRMKFAA